jgi:hypothetical protein
MIGSLWQSRDTNTVDPKYIFICAAGHAGSTLLNLLLGSHPKGLAVGEITHLPKNISIDSTCSCGQPVSACEFWHQTIDEFGDRLGIDLWSNPYRLDLGYIMDGTEIDQTHQTRLRMMRRKIAYGLEYASFRWNTPAPGPVHVSLVNAARNKVRLFDFLLEKSASDFVVDSSKHYVEAVHLYETAPEDTKIIFLVRDGRAVFNSGLRRGLTPRAALNAWNRPYARSLPVLEKRVPRKDWTTVKYEDLAKSPEVEMRKTCEFLGVPFTTEMLKISEIDSHIANGNRMRLRKDTAIRLDERWRDELPIEMLNYFERRAGDLNRDLGYGE